MTFGRSRFAFLFVALSVSALAQDACPANDPTSNVTCKDRRDGRLQWIIEQPEVRKSLTEYSQIRFEKGQTVTVSAEGCVNVHAGSTAADQPQTDPHPDWRDYVEPTGNGIDRHYHGLIWIPGARVVHNGKLLAVPVGSVPVRIGSIAETTKDGAAEEAAQELVIDDPPIGIEPTLRLGYEGGLDRHPWCYLRGTCLRNYPTMPYPPNGRCKPARVTVTVATCKRPISGHTLASNTEGNQESAACTYRPPDSNPARTFKPFDVVSDEVDPNGFLMAPQWFNTHSSGDLTRLKVSDECSNFPYRQWWNVYPGVRATCTQQASYDVPKVFTECLLAPGFGQFHGHVNWAPATFVGRLEFQEVSADKDADIQLKTIGDRIVRFPGNRDFGTIAPILTKDSQISSEYQNALWLEFATYETTTNFQPPWNKIGPSNSNDAKSFAIDYRDRTAIVTGLLDLDCVHDCHTELHPVFAMAVRRKLESSDATIAQSDPWAVFVRDAGNEGDCSQDEHYLDRNGYTFFLPAPPGAAKSTPTVIRETFKSNEKGLIWSLDRSTDPKSNGALLRISFTPTQAACNRIHSGEMAHVSGEIELDWTKPVIDQVSQSCQAPGVEGNDQSPYALVRVDKECQERVEKDNCTTPSHDNPLGGASDDLKASQNSWSQAHFKNHPDLTPANLAKQIADFLGSDLGLFEELTFYNNTSQIQSNFGGRFGIIQTPLGSVEVDGAPGLSRSVRSTNGQNLSVKMSDWMAGLKVQFTQQLGMFAEAKGGRLYRSASPGFATTPDFKNFHGQEAFYLFGGGIQPGANVLAKGTKITVRVSVDYLRVPSTGENMIRLTIGPQLQIHRHGQ